MAGAIRKESAEKALLRYRFGGAEQLRAHLVSLEGTMLLFFRDPSLSLATGAEGLLEITFQNTEQTFAVHFSVLARAEGAGMWLAMPAARFAREVREGGPVERKGRRLGADLALRLRRQSGGEYLVVLADVGLSGARVTGGLPASLAKGDHVELRLASPAPGEPVEPMQARVAWRNEQDAGIEIDRTAPSSRSAATKLFQTLETRWRAAKEIHHPDLCCRGGVNLDPSPPRVHRDGKAS